MGITIQVGSTLGLIPTPFGEGTLDIDEHCRTNVPCGAFRGIGSAAGQHSAIELRRLESNVWEMRSKVRHMLAGSGCGVQCPEIWFGCTEQCAEDIQNWGGVALGRLVCHFVGAAAGPSGCLMGHLGIGSDTSVRAKVSNSGQEMSEVIPHFGCWILDCLLDWIGFNKFGFSFFLELDLNV